MIYGISQYLHYDLVKIKQENMHKIFVNGFWKLFPQPVFVNTVTRARC